MNQQIVKMIEEHNDCSLFSMAVVTDEIIEKAESFLEIRLPHSYVEYIKKYGHGGIGGFEILGVGKNGAMVFVETTLEYRNQGLPHELVVIENCDEWLECIDCNTGKIISWDLSNYSKVDFECFDDYLISRLNDVIENL